MKRYKLRKGSPSRIGKFQAITSRGSLRSFSSRSNAKIHQHVTYALCKLILLSSPITSKTTSKIQCCRRDSSSLRERWLSSWPPTSSRGRRKIDSSSLEIGNTNNMWASSCGECIIVKERERQRTYSRSTLERGHDLQFWSETI